MQFLYGALTMVLFLLCVYGAYRAGQKSRKPSHKGIDEQEARKAKDLRQSFHQMMSYDVSTAYGKKVE